MGADARPKMLGGDLVVRMSDETERHIRLSWTDTVRCLQATGRQVPAIPHDEQRLYAPKPIKESAAGRGLKRKRSDVWAYRRSLEGWTEEDIAQALGISVLMARSAISRAEQGRWGEVEP